MNPAIRTFFRGVAAGDVNLVRALIAQGADVNTTNQAGQTPLMLATALRRNEVVRVLLANGADVDALDDLGLNASDWAGNSLDMIELLRSGVELQNPQPTVEAAEPINTVEDEDHRANFQTSDRLKGLAAAILRDHAPRTVANSPVPVEDEHTPAHQFLRAKPQTNNDVSLIEQTVDERWRTETRDDTAARQTRLPSRRIFDLQETSEAAKPRSKVEVSVPAFNSNSHQKRGVVVWLLVLVVLAAGGFAGYRLTSYLLRPNNQNTAGPTAAAATPIQPATVVAPTKLAPVVGTELNGAELHLPDVSYPDNAKPGLNETVTVQVKVSRKGIVVSAKAIDGDESLRSTAEATAMSSAFSPEKLQGKPDQIDSTITYHFIATQLLGTETTKEDQNSKGVSVVAGGPLAGSELKLITPETSTIKDLTGSVTVVVRVGRNGRVISWRPLDGNTQLRSLAVLAAKRSTFSPDKLPGKGEVVGTITYTFTH